jgi:hypothetical protein
MTLLGRTMEELDASPDPHMRYSLVPDKNGFAAAEVSGGWAF